MRLEGKVAVVTGGARGIGRAMAEAFAAEGAAGVVVGDLDADGAREVADAIGGAGLGIDVATLEGNEELVATAEQRFGPVDLFCANAGIGTPGGLEVPDEEWDRTWQVNVMAHVHAARAVLPGMLERGSGYLLHTASAAGLLSNIGTAPYTVTKHAVVGLAEWLAITYGDAGINFSCLCPQGVDTAMLREGSGLPAGAVVLAQGAITPEECAAAVVAGLDEERFLILPHPEVHEFLQRKAGDHDRWLAGMRRLQARIASAIAEA